ncbi:hypothetical protein DTO021C3_3445 [Paecilomyces variotii]|nr:hypothetical protein DTO195F2_4233 [Paecilomyces variotii]KAJ9288920.1 hypothetical protein DTO021C3_3445 [Paecilomyces variotii]
MSSNEGSVLGTEDFQDTSIQEFTVATNGDHSRSDDSVGEPYQNRIFRMRQRRRSSERDEELVQLIMG